MVVSAVDIREGVDLCHEMVVEVLLHTSIVNIIMIANSVSISHAVSTEARHSLRASKAVP